MKINNLVPLDVVPKVFQFLFQLRSGSLLQLYTEVLALLVRDHQTCKEYENTYSYYY